MGCEASGNTATLKWWEELEHYKKDNWCCSTLKEGAFEEHLKLEFDGILPIKFIVNYCCQCGTPLKEEYERNEDGDRDWCCRLMEAIGFEWLEFEKADREIYTMRVNYCFNCGRRLRDKREMMILGFRKEEKR
jgi:hypothetical protein